MPSIHDARDTYGASLAFLVTRDEIPHLLNARGLFGCGVEVGVKEGEYSAHLLERWHGAHLISVDPWAEDAPDAYVDIANVPQDIQEQFYQRTVARLRHAGARSSIWRMPSTEAAAKIPAHSLDFVYLDARHDYESVMEDLHAWFDRVRPGGVLAGHDYLDGDFPAGVFGVKRAVDEFLSSRGIRVHATLDDEPWLSWVAEIPLPASLFAGAEMPPEAEELASPAPAAATAPADERTISLALTANGTAHALQLCLDPAQMTQRIMLETLGQNALYEPETSAFFAAALQPGDTFIDVGGHVGYFSLLAAAFVGTDGQVITFEPEPANFARLGRHVELNGLANMELVNAAVADADGTAELWVNADNDGGHALWDVGDHPFNQISRTSQQVREVQTTTLDSYLHGREIESLKAIKIDAEGCEHRVLAGARATLERYRVPFVVVEINRFALAKMGSTDLAVRESMEALDYETYVLMPDGSGVVRLRPDQRVQSAQVYNLLFRHPDAPDLGAAA